MPASIFPTLAVLLAIVQAPPPVPRKTTNPSAASGRDIKNNSTNEQAPTASSFPVQNATGSPKKEDSGQRPGQTNASEPIRISELPTVSVSADWWTRSSVILTGLLVLVGAVGTSLALRTVRSIEKQTAAIVEGQRPKIAANPHGSAVETVQDLAAPRVEMELSNRGLTAASDFLYETWIEVLALPFTKFTSGVDHFKSKDRTVLYPDSPPLIINIPIERGVTNDQLDALRKGDLHVCFRIRATYKDAFSPKQTVSFGFVTYPRGLGYLPKYNQQGEANKDS